MKENDKLIIQKVLVLGCSGSGKSTFAARLLDLSGLPLFHLDNIWWKPDRTHISREDFDAKLGELIALDRWIIDGDYSRTYEPRIAACDTVFFLDYGQEVCRSGLTERVGRKRADIPWTEKELDPELVELVKKYESQNKPVLLDLFKRYPEKQVIVFRSRTEADHWLQNYDSREK